MKIMQKTYSNGLRVVLEKNDKNVIAINTLFFVGSQNEEKHQEGYSHFIEHLIFKGTEKRTAEQISDEFTMLGADFNAYTSRTSTRFIFKCLAENFEKCFEVYSDMILNASFREEDINKERNVVIEEMKSYQDEPVDVLYAKVMDNYFDGNSFAHDELGDEEIIKNVTKEQLLEYKHKFYVAKNCLISVAGNIEFEKLDELIQKYFVFENDKKGMPSVVNFKKFDINVKNQFDVVNRADNQANVCIHIKSETCDSPLRFVAEAYNCILGSMQNSRLYKRIREELGLVYTIYSFLSLGAQTGELFIMLGTRPENLKQAIIEIRKIIDDLAENGIFETELVMAKNFKKSNIEFLSETNSELAKNNGTNVHLFGKVISLEERANEIDSVTIKDVNDYAKTIANEQIFNIVAVGNNLKISDIELYLKK